MTVKLYTYSIPLKRPIKMRGCILTERTGFLVKTSFGVGELAPLPHFSLESQTEALTEAKALAHALNNGDSFTPSTPSGSMALLMLTTPLSEIPPLAPYNFILGEPQSIPNQISILYNKNKRIFKLKAGLYQLKNELELFRSLNEQFPHAKFIVDANKSLTPQDAKQIAQALNSKLLYMEDPCIDLKSSLQLNIPLGLDELGRGDFINQLVAHKINLPINVKLVQKPTINFDLTANLLPQLLSQTANGALSKYQNILNRLILSSSFESIFGIRYIEKLSTALGLLPPGTDTLKYFVEEALSEKVFWDLFTRELEF